VPKGGGRCSIRIRGGVYLETGGVKNPIRVVAMIPIKEKGDRWPKPKKKAPPLISFPGTVRGGVFGARDWVSG